MSETTKTVVFVAVALCTVGAAWVSRPKTVGVAPPGAIGKPLFEQFDNPDQAKQMEVVEFDEDLGQFSTFRVAQQKDGIWVIPSHSDYPADAKENLAEAATVLVGLEVVNVVSDKKKDHITFGVVRPDRDQVSLGDEGVGKLIAMKDDQGRTLAELIIGKEVQGQPGQRYVRAGKIDRVYTVKIDPDSMSTKFEDWIESDVLNLNGMDITEITIRDYSASPEMTQRGISLNDQQRLEMTVVWNDQDFKWDLKELLELRGNELNSTSLLASEELNKTTLDGLKNALDDLQIVDVERKPAGLGAGLKAAESFWNDEEGIRSLFSHGFFPVQMPDGAMKLRSSDGEVEVRTKAGVVYLFRFGQVAGIEQGSEQSKLNRFVMVTASLDANAFEKPQPPAGMDADVASNEPATPENGEAPDSETVDSETADAETADAETADAETADAETADAETADAEATADGDEKAGSERDELLKQYEQQLDDYHEQIAQAEKRVKDLNYRFSDWYYVIPEDEYKKIHLRRSDVVTVKESATEEGFGFDALRTLETEGLESEVPAAPGN